MPSVKVIKGNVFANKLTKIGTHFLFKLKVNYEKRRIYLIIVNYNLKVLSDDLYWDFDSLEDKLVRKDKKLAIVEFYKKEINGDNYYKYVNLSMYKLKNFDYFIKCIDEGKIFLVIKTGVFKKGKYQGKFKNHGTSFRISKDYMKYLFETVT